mgnify:CR=1 FL=1
MSRLRFSLAACFALLSVPAHAGEPSPIGLPQIGSVAPAFALSPFRSKSTAEDDFTEKLELDDYCGMHPRDNRFILVAFSDFTTLSADLGIMSTLHRKLGRDGVVPIVVSVAKETQPVRDLVGQSKLSFPVLDDQYTIVARRYGATAPFSLLLDHECRVLGMSNKSLTTDSARITKTLQTLVAGISAELPE